MRDQRFADAQWSECAFDRRFRCQEGQGYIRTLALDDPSDTVPGWVMVFATSYPVAIRAADLVKVDWVRARAQTSPSGIFSTMARNRSQTRRAASYWWTITGSTQRSEARIRRSNNLHHQQRAPRQLEPVNALAFEKDGIFEIHTAISGKA